MSAWAIEEVRRAERALADIEARLNDLYLERSEAEQELTAAQARLAEADAAEAELAAARSDPRQMPLPLP